MVECFLYKEDVAGSSPVRPTNVNRGARHVVEHHLEIVALRPRVKVTPELLDQINLELDNLLRETENRFRIPKILWSLRAEKTASGGINVHEVTLN